MAAAEGVSLVDVYRAFNGDVTTLVDFDGLHPTAAGYRVIADAFFKVIQQTLDVTVTTTAIPTPGSPVFFAPPRRHSVRPPW